MADSTPENEIKTILITGGNGCLGRFLVELILKEFPDVAVIKIFDQNPQGQEYFREIFSDHATNGGKTRVEYLVEDIRNSKAIQRAVHGVDCVFHAAAVMDVSMFPDDNIMWAVNCRGTQDLVETCFTENVPYLIYSSSVNAVLDSQSHVQATEDTTPKPKTWFWGGYGETKWYAERVVLDADNLVLSNGKTFRTLSLRPTLFYGENDTINIAKCIKTAKQCGGTLWRFGGSEDMAVQQTYVGNVAWAHIVALKALLKNPDTCAGQAYFITDDTPIQDVFSITEPFLQDRDMQLSSWKLPFAFLFYALLVFSFILSFSQKIFGLEIPLTLREASAKQLQFLRMNFSFSRGKAERQLGYRPRFSVDEAIRRSRKYYKSLF